ALNVPVFCNCAPSCMSSCPDEPPLKPTVTVPLFTNVTPPANVNSEQLAASIAPLAPVFTTSRPAPLTVALPFDDNDELTSSCCARLRVPPLRVSVLTFDVSSPFASSSVPPETVRVPSSRREPVWFVPPVTWTVMPDSMQAMSETPGTRPVDQLLGVCQVLPLAPVQLSVHMDSTTTAVAAELLEAEPRGFVAVMMTLNVLPRSL